VYDSQVSNVPLTYLLHGGEKACIPFLSWILALSRLTCMEAGRGGVPMAPAYRIGCNVMT
jgi:hypothetical protein